MSLKPKKPTQPKSQVARKLIPRDLPQLVGGSMPQAPVLRWSLLGGILDTSEAQGNPPSSPAAAVSVTHLRVGSSLPFSLQLPEATSQTGQLHARPCLTSASRQFGASFPYLQVQHPFWWHCPAVTHSHDSPQTHPHGGGFLPKCRPAPNTSQTEASSAPTASLAILTVARPGLILSPTLHHTPLTSSRDPVLLNGECRQAFPMYLQASAHTIPSSWEAFSFCWMATSSHLSVSLHQVPLIPTLTGRPSATTVLHLLGTYSSLTPNQMRYIHGPT